MSVLIKRFYFFALLPVMFIGLAFITMGLHYMAVIFLIRPISKSIGLVMSWVGQQVGFWINPTNFISMYHLTGIGWLDFVVGGAIWLFMLICVGFGGLIFYGIQEEPEIRAIQAKVTLFSFRILFLPFSLVGIAASPIYLLNNIKIFRFLFFVFTIIFCFLTTIFDFLQVVHLGSQSSLSINLFTDQPYYVGNVIYTQSFIDWIKQDNVSISNFLDYWLYSLKASLLGYRIESQLSLVALIFNTIFSILYFSLGYFLLLNTVESQFSSPEGQYLQDSTKANLKSVRLVSNLISLLIIGVLLNFIFWWLLKGSSVKINFS